LSDLVGSRHPGAVLAATVLGSSLAFIDSSVVNVALSAIAHDLDLGPAALTWSINAYLLPLGALLLLGGALGDRYGRRRLFLLGISIFTLASLVCASASSAPWLIAGRAAQGLGAAMLTPNSLALLGSAFSKEGRGRAIGIWSSAGALAGALGPLVGGQIVDSIGWRYIFLVNVPIGLIAAGLACLFIEGRQEDDQAAPVDWGGAVTATLGIGLATLALTTMVERQGAGMLGPYAIGAASIACLVLFVVIEVKTGDRALAPPALFATREVVGLNLLTILLYASLGGLVTLLPFALIRLSSYSATAAGSSLLPLPIIIALGSPIVGRWTAKRGVRGALTLGSCLVALGLALLADIHDADTSYLRDILLPICLVATGMALCVAPLTTAAMAAVDQKHVGAASGVNNTVARLGGLVATAVLGFVFARAESVEGLSQGIQIAAFTGATWAAAAALCAFYLVGRRRLPPVEPIREA
jgi:EmrB/QacA subfamily drug resistance transporter